MSSDAELLHRYAEGKSEAAFAELVGRHLDLVYSAALRQVGGDAHRAQDVAQVVFTTLARKAGSLTRHPVLAGWLYTATRHAAGKALRTEVRRKAREQEALIMEEISSTGESTVDWDRVRPVLDEAMRELNEHEREAVLLRFFARQPFGQIGAALRVSEDAARMRVERALEKLQRALSRRGVASTSAVLAFGLVQHAATAAPSGLGAKVVSVAIASSGTGALGVVAFMSTGKFIGASIAGMLLAVGVALYETAGARAAGAALEDARRQNAIALQRLRETRQTTAALQRETELMRLQLQAARGSGPREAGGGAGGVAVGTASRALPNDPVVAGKLFLERFPEVKKALVERSLARIRARFDDLYSALHLTPAQVDRFEQLMLNTEGITMNRNNGGDLPALGPLDLRPGDGRSRAEVDQALASLLGPDGMQQLRDVEDAARGQQFVMMMAEAVCFTEEPLMARQARELGALASRFPIQPGPEGPTMDWDGLTQAARSILSEGQLAALGRIRKEMEFGMTLKSRMFK